MTKQFTLKTLQDLFLEGALDVTENSSDTNKEFDIDVYVQFNIKFPTVYAWEHENGTIEIFNPDMVFAAIQAYAKVVLNKDNINIRKYSNYRIDIDIHHDMFAKSGISYDKLKTLTQN